MSAVGTSPPGWDDIRRRLCQSEPELYELEPGGALGLSLGNEGWLLEITPDGRLICQTGMDMEDIQSLLSGGTPEDLGTDELAKQAKYYLQPAVAKLRPVLVRNGFTESSEMTEQCVATLFERPVDFQNLEEVNKTIHWCRAQFKTPG